MKIPKTSEKKGLNLRVIFAIAFILFGILVFTELFGLEFITDNNIIVDTLKYGTALGSLLGGVFMLFRKKDSETPNIKL